MQDIKKLLQYIVNDFQEPKDKYSNNFYFKEIIIENFKEFEKAENYFIKNKSIKNYNNYIRTEFNLAVSIDNLRAWIEIDCTNWGRPEFKFLEIIYNVSNAIKHKTISKKKINKYLDSVLDIEIRQLSPFGGLPWEGHLLKVNCKTEKDNVKELRDFKLVVKRALKEIENYMVKVN